METKAMETKAMETTGHTSRALSNKPSDAEEESRRMGQNTGESTEEKLLWAFVQSIDCSSTDDLINDIIEALIKRERPKLKELLLGATKKQPHDLESQSPSEAIKRLLQRLKKTKSLLEDCNKVQSDATAIVGESMRAAPGTAIDCQPFPLSFRAQTHDDFPILTHHPSGSRDFSSIKNFFLQSEDVECLNRPEVEELIIQALGNWKEDSDDRLSEESDEETAREQLESLDGSHRFKEAVPTNQLRKTGTEIDTQSSDTQEADCGDDIRSNNLEWITQALDAEGETMISKEAENDNTKMDESNAASNTKKQNDEIDVKQLFSDSAGPFAEAYLGSEPHVSLAISITHISVPVRKGDDFNFLHYAAARNLPLLTRLLLALGVNPNIPTRHNRTAMMLACINGAMQVVEVFIEYIHLVSLEARDEDGCTILYYIVEYCPEDIICNFIDSIYNLASNVVSGMNNFLRVRQYQELLISRNSRTYETLFTICAKRRHRKALRRLLDLASDATHLFSQPVCGMEEKNMMQSLTTISSRDLIRHGRMQKNQRPWLEKLIKKLNERQQSFSEKDLEEYKLYHLHLKNEILRMNKNLLHQVAALGNDEDCLDLVKRLIRFGFRTDQQNALGQIPLHIAALHNHDRLIMALIRDKKGLQD